MQVAELLVRGQGTGWQDVENAELNTVCMMFFSGERLKKPHCSFNTCHILFPKRCVEQQGEPLEIAVLRAGPDTMSCRPGPAKMACAAHLLAPQSHRLKEPTATHMGVIYALFDLPESNKALSNVNFCGPLIFLK